VIRAGSVLELLRDVRAAPTEADSAQRWLAALVAMLVVLAAGRIGRWLLDRHLKRLASRTASPFDDILLDVPRPLWFSATALLALALAIRLSPLPFEPRALLGKLFLSGFLAVVVLGASRLAGAWLRQRAAATGAAAPTLLQTSARTAVLVAGGLLVLDNAGLEIAPLLTALGVGSLAVGLALQPTLSNFFAGMHLSMSRPIRVGDFIELEDGAQGHVVDVGWRATRLHQLGNNLLVVPNSRLAEMRLTNYSLPEEPQAVLVPVGVGYASDLAHVERVTLDVAREVQRTVPEADPAHEPFLRFHEFGDSAIGFNVILRARTFTDRWLVIDLFVRSLHERYRSSGIEIPFPQRVVTVRREVA
jgi:small-conductance mechanosensitive channel